MVWRRFWSFHSSLCASHNNLCSFSVDPRTQREPEGLSEATQVPLILSSFPTSVKHQTTLKPWFSWGELFRMSSCWKGIVLWLLHQNLVLSFVLMMCFYIPTASGVRKLTERSASTKQSKLLRQLFGKWLPQFPLLRSPEAAHRVLPLRPKEHISMTLIRPFVWVFECGHGVLPERTTLPKPRFQQSWEWGGPGNLKAKFLKKSFSSPENSQDRPAEIGGRLDFQPEEKKKAHNLFQVLWKQKDSEETALRCFRRPIHAALYLPSFQCRHTENVFYPSAWVSFP